MKKTKPTKKQSNNTTLFLSPMFDIILRGRHLHGFISLYLGDHEHDIQHKNCIYALFEPNFNTRFMDYEKKLQKSPYFVESYDVEDYDWEKLKESPSKVMFVFEIPKEYKKDFKAFISGKYSKFSFRYKTKFKKGTNIYNIVHRTSKMVEHWEDKLDVILPEKSEVWSIWIPEQEIYRFNPDIK